MKDPRISEYEVGVPGMGEALEVPLVMFGQRWEDCVGEGSVPGVERSRG